MWSTQRQTNQTDNEPLPQTRSRLNTGSIEMNWETASPQAGTDLLCVEAGNRDFSPIAADSRLSGAT